MPHCADPRRPSSLIGTLGGLAQHNGDVGYDVHVVRGAEWSGGLEPIESDEWRRLIEVSADLVLVSSVEATTPAGETLRYMNPDLAAWTGHPSGIEVPFDFRAGRVVVKNPDEATIDRLRGVARSLGARVQGDDGEFYDEPPPQRPEVRPPTRRRFWRR